MATRVSTPRDERHHSDRENGVLFVAAMVVVMWVVEMIDVASGHDLETHGIQPHDPDGLVGIAAAPFLHASWGHLLGNTVPFLILGAAIAWNGLKRVAWVTVIVAIVGGLGVWIFAPSGTNHIGASGVVFGYATYLISRGVFSRSAVHLGIGVVVLSLYGTTLLFGLEPRVGISWQGHLFGGIGGVLAAYWLDQRPRATVPGRRVS
ncbi:MAG: Rhomboid family protein [Solirubrobacterales bacterium]|jgi:membrane associated rhomboid family serine protease|nr:Rhomboid family protein [Solirubrobacterales bacterium]